MLMGGACAKAYGWSPEENVAWSLLKTAAAGRLPRVIGRITRALGRPRDGSRAPTAAVPRARESGLAGVGCRTPEQAERSVLCQQG